MSEQILKAIDFFCGAGGMTYGLTQAGIKVLAGIDIEPAYRETYEINNRPSKFIEADIHDLTFDRLVSETGIKCNDDSLVFIGCSPCQYWTKIHTDKKKSQESKDLLAGFQKFVDFFKPGYIILENVPGLFNYINKNVLGEFINFLDKNHYKYDHDVLNANYYGVPQKRKRYVLVATRLSETIKLPVGSHNQNLTVRNFIGKHNGFPEVENGHKDETDFIHTVARLSPSNVERIKVTPVNGGNRYSWKDDPSLQIKAYMNRDNSFKDVYGRMFWDKPSPTITTRFNSISNGRFGHPFENRAISLREGAVLQTFPKSYVFKGTNEACIARMIGNAVPPELAKNVGYSIVENYKKINNIRISG